MRTAGLLVFAFAGSIGAGSRRAIEAPASTTIALTRRTAAFVIFGRDARGSSRESPLKIRGS